jgi:hypothetical protein
MIEYCAKSSAIEHLPWQQKVDFGKFGVIFITIVDCRSRIEWGTEYFMHNHGMKRHYGI